jgi:hypothetical protein
MRLPRILGRVAFLVAMLAAVAVPPWPGAGEAASHRELPMLSINLAADIADLFTFQSYESVRQGLSLEVLPAASRIAAQP